MGNDKTSWLFDKEDDALGTGFSTDQDAGFTESIDAPNDNYSAAPTNAHMSEAPTEYVASDKTEIYHGGMAKQFDNRAEFDPMIDPIVGWLVVVKGPGLGQAINLGSGMNTLGRDPNERASLPFGDSLISSQDHLRILFDDENRVFFVVPGSGRNISRVNGQIIATTAPLENYALIELSKQTHVRFVAFCNEQFGWTELATGDDNVQS